MKKAKQKITAIYVRVSSSTQSTRSQRPDLKKWITAYTNKNDRIHWFADKVSGRSMNRPEWNKLHKKILANRVERLVIWKIDRLGRTPAGLLKLFEELQKHKCNLISMKEQLDLSTPAGRFFSLMLAGMACYEIECGSERIRAGQKVARDKGTKWGGSKKGRLNSITKEQAKAVIKMKAKGDKVCTIAKTLNMNRPSIERILERAKEGVLKLA